MPNNIHENDLINKNITEISNFIDNDEDDLVSAELVEELLLSDLDISSIINRCTDQEVKIQLIDFLFQEKYLNQWISRRNNILQLIESLMDENLELYIDKLFIEDYLDKWLKNQNNMHQLIDLLKTYERVDFLDILFQEQYLQQWFDKQDIANLLESLLIINHQDNKYIKILFTEKFIAPILAQQNDALLDIISYCIDSSQENLILQLLQSKKTTNILISHKDIFQIKNYLDEKSCSANVRMKFDSVIFTNESLFQWLEKHDIDDNVYNIMINDISKQKILLKFLQNNEKKLSDFINKYHQLITVNLARNHGLKDIISNFINQNQNALNLMKKTSNKSELFHNLIDIMKQKTIDTLLEEKNISSWINNEEDAKQILKILLDNGNINSTTKTKDNLEKVIARFKYAEYLNNSHDQLKNTHNGDSSWVTNLYAIVKKIIHNIKQIFIKQNYKTDQNLSSIKTADQNLSSIKTADQNLSSIKTADQNLLSSKDNKQKIQVVSYQSSPKKSKNRSTKELLS